MYLGPSRTYYNPKERVWSGRRGKDLFGANITLGEAIHFVLSKINGDKVIQVTDPSGETVTASELLRNSKVLCHHLQEDLGLEPGDVIGVSATNSTHVSCLFLAAFLCGTPTNAIYPELDKENIKIIFKVTQPKVIFCDMENCVVVKQAAHELNLAGDIFILNGVKDGFRNIKELLIDNGREIDVINLPCSRLTGNDIAAIACSSGTTSTPKGVLCSHRALLHGTAMFDLQSDSVLFSFSTMYWVSGLWIFIAALLNGARRIITDQPFTPEYFQHLVEKHRITHTISGVHQMAELLEAATPSTALRLSSIRCILCGGSRVPTSVSEGINKILGDIEPGLTVGYSMTELSGMLSENDGGPSGRREGSVGKLMANIDVKIVGEDSKLMDVGEKGIVHVRTPHFWAGYYQNPDATRKAYVDGWLVTGDIGYFDSDGFLHILSRDNDIFKSNGIQIYPTLIEEVIARIPGVAEVCVFGIPDFVSGHLTACAVVRTLDNRGRNVTKEKIDKWLEENMAKIYHMRGGVFFVEALPKTGSGKIQRCKVLEMVKGQETV